MDQRVSRRLSRHRRKKILKQRQMLLECNLIPKSVVKSSKKTKKNYKRKEQARNLNLPAGKSENRYVERKPVKRKLNLSPEHEHAKEEAEISIDDESQESVKEFEQVEQERVTDAQLLAEMEVESSTDEVQSEMELDSSVEKAEPETSTEIVEQEIALESLMKKAEGEMESALSTDKTEPEIELESSRKKAEGEMESALSTDKTEPEMELSTEKESEIESELSTEKESEMESEVLKEKEPELESGLSTGKEPETESQLSTEEADEPDEPKIDASTETAEQVSVKIVNENSRDSENSNQLQNLNSVPDLQILDVAQNVKEYNQDLQKSGKNQGIKRKRNDTESSSDSNSQDIPLDHLYKTKLKKFDIIIKRLNEKDIKNYSFRKTKKNRKGSFKNTKYNFRRSTVTGINRLYSEELLFGDDPVQKFKSVKHSNKNSSDEDSDYSLKKYSSSSSKYSDPNSSFESQNSLDLMEIKVNENQRLTRNMCKTKLGESFETTDESDSDGEKSSSPLTPILTRTDSDKSEDESSPVLSTKKKKGNRIVESDDEESYQISEAPLNHSSGQERSPVLKSMKSKKTFFAEPNENFSEKSETIERNIRNKVKLNDSVVLVKRLKLPLPDENVGNEDFLDLSETNQTTAKPRFRIRYDEESKMSDDSFSTHDFKLTNESFVLVKKLGLPSSNLQEKENVSDTNLNGNNELNISNEIEPNISLDDILNNEDINNLNNNQIEDPDSDVMKEFLAAIFNFNGEPVKSTEEENSCDNFFISNILSYYIVIEVEGNKFIISHFKKFMDGTVETSIIEHEVDLTLSKFMKLCKYRKKKIDNRERKVFYKWVVYEDSNGKIHRSLQLRTKKKFELGSLEKSEKTSPESTFRLNDEEDNFELFDFNLDADELLKKGEEDLGLRDSLSVSPDENFLESLYPQVPSNSSQNLEYTEKYEDFYFKFKKVLEDFVSPDVFKQQMAENILVCLNQYS